MEQVRITCVDGPYYHFNAIKADPKQHSIINEFVQKTEVILFTGTYHLKDVIIIDGNEHRIFSFTPASQEIGRVKIN